MVNIVTLAKADTLFKEIRNLNDAVNIRWVFLHVSRGALHVHEYYGMLTLFQEIDH